MLPRFARSALTTLAVAALAALAAACDDPPPPTSDPTPTLAPPSPSGEALPLPAGAISGTLLFSSETADARDDVFSLDLEDPEGPRRRLTDGPAREFDPDLSPDGKHIVYRVNPDPESDEADLWIMDADGSNPRNLTSAPELNNWSPAWSPDGSRIAFASTRDGGTLRVWTMDATGAALRPVTAAHGEYPDWSPDGERIVYAAPAAGGRYDLWVVDSLGTRSPAQLTNTTTTEFAPAWSPDGEWIAYQLDQGARWELWIMRADGSHAHRLSPEGEDGVWPAWSPDGLLAWAGTQGLSFVTLATEIPTSFEPATPGTDFLSWGR